MKRKLVSSLLAVVMLLVCTVPSFATQIEPRDRYKTVVVTDPNWTYQSTMTITKEQAKDIEVAKAAILVSLGGIIAAGSLGVLATTAAGMASVWAVSGGPEDEGVYTFEKKYRTTYYEDLSTGARHVHMKEILFRVTFEGGGDTSVEEMAFVLR